MKEEEGVSYRVRRLSHLAGAAVFLALIVVVFGAYVRISDAGLACPDWPGCYGKLLVPSGAEAAIAQQRYPDQPLDPVRAWKELLHRYLAAGLGLLILVMTFTAARTRLPPPGKLPGRLPDCRGDCREDYGHSPRCSAYWSSSRRYSGASR